MPTSSESPRRLCSPPNAEVASRYAEAMPLHPFLSRLGTGEVLASLRPRAFPHYDASSLVALT